MGLQEVLVAAAPAPALALALAAEAMGGGIQRGGSCSTMPSCQLSSCLGPPPLRNCRGRLDRQAEAAACVAVLVGVWAAGLAAVLAAEWAAEWLAPGWWGNRLAWSGSNMPFAAATTLLLLQGW